MIPAAHFLLIDHSAGLLILVFVIDVFGGEVVLDRLVFDNAHARLFDSHFGQRYPGVNCSQRGVPENSVHLFLRKAGECFAERSWRVRSEHPTVLLW